MASSQLNFHSSSNNNSRTLQLLEDSNHKKRRKIETSDSVTNIPWRSETRQRLYSTDLAQALRRNPPAPKPTSGREVRVTADQVLAATAKGRTRWSRAILASRLGRWKMQQHKKKKKVKKVGTGFVKRKPESRRRLPVVEKKVRILSRLVPGCRKASLPNLLEEATDYISALEMQVRAMTALAELLAGGAPPENWP
ncbi:hypothetical protein RIF29_24599 [Crotalaria pallida]|uniref:BHLH domain-containing protein n=1 Tax=Crotalaria pallida TaxID=3830 RepID=A0AAN9EQ85_CROPI